MACRAARLRESDLMLPHGDSADLNQPARLLSTCNLQVPLQCKGKRSEGNLSWQAITQMAG